MNKKLTLTLLTGLTVLAGCNSSPPAPSSSTTTSHHNSDIEIEIMFDGNKCPIGVNKTIAVSKTYAKKINWQSVDSSNTPVPQDYKIFFDPFKGQPIKSVGNSGATVGINLNSQVPEHVTFKYTIVGDNCLDYPLDPRIIIY